MFNLPILSVITFMPLLGAIFIMMMRGSSGNVIVNAKRVALWAAVVTFILILALWTQFNPKSTDLQFTERYLWLQRFHTAVAFGVDGISFPFVLLTGFLTPLCILASWKSVEKYVKAYLALFLVLETLIIGTFLATDLILFYIFFEAVLIPMYFIIGIWGGEHRVYAAFKFFLYTLLGSVLMLVAIMAMVVELGSSNMMDVTGRTFSYGWQMWLWLAFFVSFAIKMPMWPVHTWLPDAHVEAPTAGSVILAGILLKMGGYGFIRFLLPMFPDASLAFAPLVYTLSLIAVIYASLVALVQEDMKKLIAYSSIAHMGFVTMGLFTFDHQGVQGAVAQMVSHGLISSALFLCIGVIYDRMHTRDIAFYGGLVTKMPKYATLFLIVTMASVGLPGTSGFVAEFMVLLGSIRIGAWPTLLLASSMVLGAVYMLYMLKRVVFGKMENQKLADIKDLSGREMLILMPLASLIILMGIFPAPLLKLSELSVERILKIYRMPEMGAENQDLPMEGDKE